MKSFIWAFLVILSLTGGAGSFKKVNAIDAYHKAIAYSGGRRLHYYKDHRTFNTCQQRLVHELWTSYEAAGAAANAGDTATADAHFGDILDRLPPSAPFHRHVVAWPKSL